MFQKRCDISFEQNTGMSEFVQNDPFTAYDHTFSKSAHLI